MLGSRRERSQGVPEIFRAPMWAYRVHCAVIFAIAQLLCTLVELIDELRSNNAYLLKIATNRIHYSDCPEVQLTKKIQLI